MNNNNNNDNEIDIDKNIKSTEVDETQGVIVYGNLKIRDVDTNKILIDKRA